MLKLQGRIWQKNEIPKAILYKDDIEPEDDELLIIASISSDINKATRSLYGWHSDAIQDEYEQIKSELAKT